MSAFLRAWWLLEMQILQDQLKHGPYRGYEQRMEILKCEAMVRGR